MSTISPEARRELVTAVAERYQHSTSAEKGWILDEFVALTGYHPKHAIRLLNGSSVTPGVRRGRRCVYDDAVTDRLRAVLGTVDPLGLLDEIRAVQHHLAGLAAAATVHPMPQRDADLDGVFYGVSSSPGGPAEVRPTHRPRKRPPRHWRTRRDPFETTWPRVVQWLEAEPHRTAKELFERLRREHPGRFAPGPASDAATPRQGLAPGRSSSSPLQRSEWSVPGRSCVGHHRTRTSPPRSGTGRYAIRPRRYRRARPSSALTGTRNGHYGDPSHDLGCKSSVRSL